MERWYLAVEVGQGGSPEQAGEKAAALLEALLEEGRQEYHLREMTENPLLLSTICLVHYSGDRLPEKRARLYDDCIGFLLETWAEQRPGQPSLPNTAARQVLQPLAWHMQERQERTLSGAEVKAAVAPTYGQVRGLDLSLDEFLRRARDDCGLLTGSDIDSYEFLHQSFQEYLAAAHARADGRIEALADRIDEPYWRETILLAMSMDGVFVPFMRRAVARETVAAHRELLGECFEQSDRIDPAPFLNLLERPAERRWRLLPWPDRRTPALGEVRATFGLFRGRGIVPVEERARAWASHPDPAVRLAALAVAVPAAERVDGELPPSVAGIEWVLVPKSEFVMGSSRTQGETNYDSQAYEDETPAHPVRITRGYALTRHPVTNECYGRFLRATGSKEPQYWGDRRFNQPRQPVVGVSWQDARDFCTWFTSELGGGWHAGLPTEAEWELGGRGTDGRSYPWGGDVPSPERAVFGQPWESGRPAPVGGRPAGASPCGGEDMAGNVWEWCLDAWTESYQPLVSSIDDPCHLDDGGSPRVVRGGSWLDVPWDLRAARRLWSGPRGRGRSVGWVVCRRFPDLLAFDA